MVKSLQEIIDESENNENNIRIMNNIGLSKEILVLFQKHSNPFTLRDLDYKIQNINSLANDPSLEPVERAGSAMKKFSRLSDSEVVTPEFIADKIIDSFPRNAFNNSTKTLDIASKQGEFIYAVYKKFGKKSANNFYSIPTSKIAYEFTRKMYTLLELNTDHIENNYTSYDLIEDETLIQDDNVIINNNYMKFDAIVGNPPYQDEGGSGGNNDAPIFQHFCEIGIKVSKKYSSLLIPARWFAAGRENLIGDFRRNMLNNKNIQKLHVFSNSKDLFPDVEIKGGVCFYLENKDFDDKCEYILDRDGTIEKDNIYLNTFDILIREPKLSAIIKKVEKLPSENTVDSIISADTPFGIPSNPKTSTKNPFSVYPKKSNNHNISLYHIENSKRKIEYVDANDLKKNTQDIEKYKVFIPGGYGAGETFPHQILGVPEIASKKSVCSQSYLYVAFSNKIEGENFIKYLRTKFFRSLVSSVKITQSAPKRVYRFVPLQDFTSKSDIDWKQSIEEIDKQLYKKYKLTKEEIKFIEDMIKPMN